MNFKRLILTTSVAGAGMLLMAAGASANSITFNTNQPNSGFDGEGSGSLIWGDTSGASATLTLTLNPGTTIGVPSFVDLGNLLLSCPGCSTQAEGTGSYFAPFTVDLEVDDTTDGATAMFIGTASGGTIYSDTSNILISWAPAQIGPGPAVGPDSSGNFGNTEFQIFSPTPVVAPDSGGGDTTIQGYVNTSATPEPATMALLGGALIGLGLFGKRLKKN